MTQPFLDNWRAKANLGKRREELTADFMPRSAVYVEDLSLTFASASDPSPLEVPAGGIVDPRAPYSDLDLTRDVCMVVHFLTGEGFKGSRTDHPKTPRSITFPGVAFV